MALIICSTCGRIIGCGLKKGKMINDCCFCEDYQACREAIPVDSYVKIEVIFCRFSKGCLGHNRTIIGFHNN